MELDIDILRDHILKIEKIIPNDKKICYVVNSIAVVDIFSYFEKVASIIEKNVTTNIKEVRMGKCCARDKIEFHKCEGSEAISIPENLIARNDQDHLAYLFDKFAYYFPYVFPRLKYIGDYGCWGNPTFNTFDVTHPSQWGRSLKSRLQTMRILTGEE